MGDFIKTTLLIAAVSLVVLFWATSNPDSAEKMRNNVILTADQTVDAAKEMADELTDEPQEGE